MEAQLEEIGLPFKKDILFSKVKETAREKRLIIPEHFLEYCLIKKSPIFDKKCSEKVVYFNKFSIPDNIALILKNHKQPVHIKELTYIISKFSLIQRTSNHIENRIRKDKRFILVDSGQFMFYKNYKVFLARKTGLSVKKLKKLLKKIAKETLGLLKDKTDWTDTKYILTQLKQSTFISEIITPHALKDILLRYPYFEGGRKFEIRLRLGNKQITRKKYADLIWEVLFEARSALHVKKIQKRLREKHREIPLATLNTILSNNERFLRVEESSYTIPENINFTKEDILYIKEYAYELIKSRKEPISSIFLIQQLIRHYPKYQVLNYRIVYSILKKDKKFIDLSPSFFALKDWLNNEIQNLKDYVYKLLQEINTPLTCDDFIKILVARFGYFDKTNLNTVINLDKERICREYNYIYLKEWDITLFLPTIFTSAEKEIKRELEKFKANPELTKITLDKLILWLKFCMWSDLKVESEFLLKFIKRFELIGQDKEYVERVKRRLGIS